MRKAVLLLTLLLLSLGVSSCGGGGSGSLSNGGGENPGVPSLVLLAPSSNVAQTNASITLSATVVDGNGAPVPNILVTFTKLSALGTLSTTLPVATDASGIARVNVHSSAPGFVTVVAQVSVGTGFIREKRSIFFTTSDTTNGLAFTPIAILVDVDGNNNGIYNETSDLKICEAAADNVVRVRATLFIAGVRAPGVVVNFTTDSDALASFPNTPLGTDTDFDGDIDIDSVITNSQGEAFTEVTINCLVQNNERIINVYGFTNTLFVPAFNGFFSGVGAIPLFLQPVTVTGITVTATPSTVLPSGTSRIDATVNTSAGPISGIAVSFTTSCGTVSPAVSQTSNGVATTTFTAPSTPGPCTVTARVGSVTGAAVVTVSTALSVLPSAVTINGTAGGAATFTINGGIPGYTITTNNPTFPPVPAAVAASGGTFTVTVPAGTAPTSATYTVRDSVGTTVTATLTVSAGPALSITPNSGTVIGIDNPPVGTANSGCPPDADASDDFTAFISGGTPPYVLVGTSNLAVVPVCSVTIAGSNITIDPDAVVGSTSVTITIRDSAATPQTATITLTVNP